MKKIIAVLTILFLLQNNVSRTNADIPDLPLTEYIIVDGEKISLKNGLDLSGKNLRGIEIHYLDRTLKNINFSGCDLEGADFSETSFDNCSFREAKLINLPSLLAKGSNDLTNAEIGNIEFLGITRKQLESTASFKRKSLWRIRFSTCDFRSVDFSGFDLQQIDFKYTLLTNSDFTDAVIGEGCSLGTSFPHYAMTYEQLKSSHGYRVGMTYEQLQSTRSYKDGNFINVFLNLTWPEGRADFSGMNLTGCYFGPGGTYNHVEIDNLSQFYSSSKKPEKRGWSDRCQLDLTDSVITKCNFRDFKGLTLENVKSTWNYKNNQMEGIILPKEIQEALDAEKEQQ